VLPSRYCHSWGDEVGVSGFVCYFSELTTKSVECTVVADRRDRMLQRRAHRSVALHWFGETTDRHRDVGGDGGVIARRALGVVAQHTEASHLTLAGYRDAVGRKTSLRVGGCQFAQAAELVRALRIQLLGMNRRLAWIERHGPTGKNSRASAMRSEAAALRRDIAEANLLIDRLLRRYGTAGLHDRLPAPR
jgi:hypothetical protein